MVCQSCCKEDMTRKKFKRGLWSPEEDRILKRYVLKYGHGYWSHVPKLAGLQRCGKSCRLRWINYLRPGLKRGAFSHEEQMIIINAQEIIGNKWSLIASMLPGRTDNEVKNFWNTHLKKKLNISMGRDGLNAHKTHEDCTRNEILECSSTNDCIEANELFRDIHISSSNEGLHLQSSTYGCPEEFTMPLGNQYEKPNPESKSMVDDNSFMGGVFHQWMYSDHNEEPTTNMASNRLIEQLPKLVTHSEQSSCINYKSNQYPFPKERSQIYTSSQLLSPRDQMSQLSSSRYQVSQLLSPRDQMLNFSSDLSNNDISYEESILCNDLSTTSRSSFEHWDNVSCNQVDFGFHGDYSLEGDLDLDFS